MKEAGHKTFCHRGKGNTTIDNKDTAMVKQKTQLGSSLSAK